MFYQANYEMKIGNDNSFHHPECKFKEKFTEYNALWPSCVRSPHSKTRDKTPVVMGISKEHFKLQPDSSQWAYIA